MDRNLKQDISIARFKVALRKESVDRNTATALVMLAVKLSLSARRAWIEIYHERSGAQCKGSLSARRAWIEI